MWRTALRWSRDSATHLWANLVIVVSAVIEALAQFADRIADMLADLFGDPELKSQVLALVPHDSVPLVLIAIMVIAKLARNRTLVK